MNKNIKTENIVEVALLRTGLVSIERKNLQGFDLIAYDKTNLNNIVGVEIKTTRSNQEIVIESYNDLKNRYTSQFIQKRIPIILFFIDPEKESGSFSIFDGMHNDKIFSLKMDVFTTQLKELLKTHTGIEYPPYKFFQTDDNAKYDTRQFVLNDQIGRIRLHNIYLNPIEVKNAINLEIIIQDNVKKTSYKYSLSTLFTNPKLHNYLFFVNQNNSCLDILLPRGNKFVTFKIELLSDISKFELILNCQYVAVPRRRSKPRHFA